MPELLQLMERWDGFNPVRAVQINEAAAARLVRLMSNADRMPSWRHQYVMHEAISSGDFPTLFGFVLERDLLARYQLAVPDWRGYVKVGSLPNFNQAEAHKVIGNDGLLPLVAERAPYLARVVANGHYHRQIFKYGASWDISWEAMINDVLGAFADVPQRFADSARYTEAYNVTNAIAVAAGPNPLLFGAPIADAADAANVTNQGILPLTIANVATTIALMAAQQDSQGRPLGLRAAHLVVPPALELTARAILTSALQQELASAVPVPTVNVVAQMGLSLHVNPLLAIIDVSGNNNGTWYMFADPGQIAAVQMDYLRGYETPEVCMHSSDKVTTGGVSLGAFSGDFGTDDIQYRVRVVHGASPLDPRACYAQVHV